MAPAVEMAPAMPVALTIIMDTLLLDDHHDDRDTGTIMMTVTLAARHAPPAERVRPAGREVESNHQNVGYEPSRAPRPSRYLGGRTRNRTETKPL